MSMPDDIARDAHSASVTTPRQTPRTVNDGHRYDYQVRIVSEGALGTILVGKSKVNPEKLAGALNDMARQGYRCTFQVLERRRMLLFWSRESVICTFERALSPAS
jgi:hypothetical protein